ncbi:hypothetical protein FB45DRAFT_1036320 [Roridomyces roridus]|uniref:Uncharacterized protein n=1 Tax=Roridomyces roridus TaxID=1738132 RepID=A0AAD7FB42_9AGAR|nr:hypothetical protein FB45DRAFT_1036320 [Roridomyces roridus]
MSSSSMAIGSVETCIQTMQIGYLVTMTEMFFRLLRCVLYPGAYVVLFGFYMKILLKPREFQKNPFLHSTTIALFGLSTIHLSLLLAIAALENRANIFLIADLLDPALAPALFAEDKSMAGTALVKAAFGIYVTSNVVADGIFVFRCYAIWLFRIKIVVIPTLCTIAVAFFGYWHIIRPGGQVQGFSLLTLPILISLATTILLMILSGVSLDHRSVYELIVIQRDESGGWHAERAKYWDTGPDGTTLLESGALYYAGAVIVAILSMLFYNRSASLMSAAISAQLVGIAPTLIAVRVGLNRSVESVDSFAIAVQRPRRQLSSVDFHISTTEPVQQPGVIYLRPESITEVQKIATV